MMGGLAIGLFVAFIVYLNNITRSTHEEDSIATVIQDTFTDLKENAEKHERQHSQQSIADKPKATAKKEHKPKTDFDFYYILPELEVAVPDRELASRAQQAKASPQQENTEYIIQAGAFRKAEQADNLKAKLALQGIVAYIQTVNVNSDTWHRVRIGPVKDISQLNKTRKRLRDNGIDTIVVEPKG
jgi:cell division protein FtsN